MATTANPTRDDFAKLLDEQLGGADGGFEGRVVKGTITAIENGMAVIDVGLKSEGRVDLKEFMRGEDEHGLEVGSKDVSCPKDLGIGRRGIGAPERPRKNVDGLRQVLKGEYRPSRSHYQTFFQPMDVSAQKVEGRPVRLVIGVISVSTGNN